MYWDSISTNNHVLRYTGSPANFLLQCSGKGTQGIRQLSKIELLLFYKGQCKAYIEKYPPKHMYSLIMYNASIPKSSTSEKKNMRNMILIVTSQTQSNDVIWWDGNNQSDWIIAATADRPEEPESFWLPMFPVWSIPSGHVQQISAIIGSPFLKPPTTTHYCHYWDNNMYGTDRYCWQSIYSSIGPC